MAVAAAAASGPSGQANAAPASLPLCPQCRVNLGRTWGWGEVRRARWRLRALSRLRAAARAQTASRAAPTTSLQHPHSSVKTRLNRSSQRCFL